MIRFTKMHGIGNDYIYVNGFEEIVSDPAALAPKISDRHFGVGGDGLILVLPPEQGVEAHVRMRMFNADGSESEMCGNGIRCVCKLAHDRGICAANPMRIQTGAGVLNLNYTLDGNGRVEMVTVDMGEPTLDADRIPVRLSELNDLICTLVGTDMADQLFEERSSQSQSSDGGWTQSSESGVLQYQCLSMGNPHLVIFTRDVSKIPLSRLGPMIEYHPAFPKRVNVHVVEVHSPLEITMRTWERGSGMTLACGTGASAVCVAGVLTRRTDREILAHLPGGDLILRWDEKTNHVFKTGSATEVFTGEWND